MSYELRERPDGQVEIVILTPVLFGVFPTRDFGTRVLALLRQSAAPAPGPSPDTPVLRHRSSYPRGRVPEPPGKDAAPPAADPDPQPVPALPVPVTTPSPVPVLRRSPGLSPLTDEQKEAAFARLTSGEKIAAVAPDFGVTMQQLRGMWASYKSGLQRHFAEGGQQPCSLCRKPFTPSLSRPDTCARCSHEVGEAEPL